MGKTIKRRNVKRRKTRRRKLKGGRESKVALYVWKNPDDKTFQKRVFVEDYGMDYTDYITDAGYNLRWIAGEGGNTIPRKPAGINGYQDIKPYVKYMTADYAEGNTEVNPAEREILETSEVEGEAQRNQSEVASKTESTVTPKYVVKGILRKPRVSTKTTKKAKIKKAIKYVKGLNTTN